MASESSVDVLDSATAACDDSDVKRTVPSNYVLTTWDDLAKAGISPKGVEKMYDKKYGVTPDKVYLNDGICKDYGHYCYNIQGVPKYNNQKRKTMTKLGDSRVIENNSDFTVKYHVTLSSSHTKSASVTVTNSSSFTFGGSITMGSEQLGIELEFQTTFTVTNSVGSTSSTSSDVTVSDSLDFTLDAGQKVEAQLEITWESLTQEFEIPFTIKGWTGASFPKRVKNHYFWFMTLKNKYDTPTSTLRGVVECAYDIKGRLRVNNIE